MTTMSNDAASGARVSLRAGDYSAQIAGTGASLRALRFRGRDLVMPFDAHDLRPAMRGALLAPWPNRLQDGRYTFGGRVHQLPVDEPETRCAVHGLVAWTDFEVVSRTPDAAELTATIAPRPGYPWRVRIEASFALTADGLRQEVLATNLSRNIAPFGLGWHPYLLAGEPGQAAIDRWSLLLEADEALLICDDRMLPTRLVRVSGAPGAFDFRTPRSLSGVGLNHAFTSLRRSPAGLARARLTSGSGHGAELEWDERCGWVQVYTSDAGSGEEYRHAVAVEPMTCPPNALASGTDLIVLAPGGSTGAAWTIRAIQPK